MAMNSIINPQIAAARASATGGFRESSTAITTDGCVSQDVLMLSYCLTISNSHEAYTLLNRPGF